MVFETSRDWECVSASKFAKIVAVSPVYLALVEQVGDLHFTHRSAHSGQAHEARFEGSQELLDELKSAHPQIFAEPMYPITDNHVPFTIPLIDPSMQPKKRKLYPMLSLEPEELQKQIKLLLESGRIVPSSSPYGAPILFTEKKGRGGLRMCTDYRSLNSNTVSDSWPLPRIDEMLARLKGARYFSKLDLREGYH